MVEMEVVGGCDKVGGGSLPSTVVESVSGRLGAYGGRKCGRLVVDREGGRRHGWPGHGAKMEVEVWGRMKLLRAVHVGGAVILLDLFIIFYPPTQQQGLVYPPIPLIC